MMKVNPIEKGVRIEGQTKWADFDITIGEDGKIITSSCTVKKTASKSNKKDCGCGKRKKV